VIREAVELVLKSDLGADTGGQKPVSGEKVVDAGALLQKGLQILANNPYAALDIQLGVQTMDVHKAFRKMALKYHPDKSPKTTALFQAIQAASEKLSDAGSRRQEEQRAAAFNMANTTAGRNAVPTKPSAPPPSSFKPPHMPSFNFNRAPPAGPTGRDRHASAADESRHRDR
jgi:DnaJ-class molecular chaperone